MLLSFARRARRASSLSEPSTRVQAIASRPWSLDPSDPLMDEVRDAMPAGEWVTMESALQVSAVWACIDVISKALAASPWNIYKRLPKGDWDLLPDDALAYILNTRPNPEMTAINCRQGLLICALSWGNGYAEIVRDRANRVVELWPLMPDCTEPFRDPRDGVLKYRYRNPGGVDVVLAAEQVYHLRGPGISGLVGDNFIARAAKTIALAMAAEKFSSTYFGNNTVIAGTLSTTQALNEKTREELKKQLEERHRGARNSNRPMLLEGGLKWESIGNKPEDSQLVESRKMQIEEICRWYGVPPHKIAHLDRSTFNNIEHLGIEFVRDALTPWKLRLDQEADYKLFPIRGAWRFTRHDIEWLSQGDAQSRANAKQVLRRNGIITANDWLKSEGMNTIGPEGDIRIVEGNMTRLEQVGEQTTAAAPSTAAVESEDDPEEDEELAPSDSRRALRDAAQLLFAAVYDRHVRRVENRSADLESWGKPPHEIAARLTDFRERERERVHDELQRPCEFLARIARADIDAIRLTAKLRLDDAFTESATAAAAAVVAQYLE